MMIFIHRQKVAHDSKIHCTMDHSAGLKKEQMLFHTPFGGSVLAGAIALKVENESYQELSGGGWWDMKG